MGMLVKRCDVNEEEKIMFVDVNVRKNFFSLYRNVEENDKIDKNNIKHFVIKTL